MGGWTPQMMLVVAGATAAGLGLLLVAVQFLYEIRNRSLGQHMRSGSINRSGQLSFQTSYIGVLVFLVGAALLIIAALITR